MESQPSLRERKKQQTRLRISEAATALFIARGFDEVSVAEVAEAAEVSKMTVFNYFPRKEELLLDRVPEAIELVTTAIRGRAPGRSPLDALHALVLDLAERRHPLSGIGDTMPAFWRTVLDSPALRAYAREALEQLEDHLARLIAEEPGRLPGEEEARFAAALGMTACRTVFTATARRILAGEPADAVAADHRAFTDRVFAAVARAFAEFAEPAEPSAGPQES
ncbi:TetR/AcrR family transcriptional regulator [Kitasatospora atroaurantiaca]|nr:TetR/AcrR family transcriptional regulator [Kitasatospora atroaurantiaca]